MYNSSFVERTDPVRRTASNFSDLHPKDGLFGNGVSRESSSLASSEHHAIFSFQIRSNPAKLQKVVNLNTLAAAFCPVF